MDIVLPECSVFFPAVSGQTEMRDWSLGDISGNASDQKGKICLWL